MQDFDGKGAKGRRSKEEIQKRNKEVSSDGQGLQDYTCSSTSCTATVNALCTVDLPYCVSSPHATLRQEMYLDVMQAQQRFRDRQKVRRDFPKEYNASCITSLLWRPAWC